MKVWLSLGEEKLVNWFVKIYLNGHWSNWINACSPVGIARTNNVLETNNNTSLKSLLIGHKNQTLSAALSPGGYLELVLLNTDLWNHVSSKKVIPPNLSQMDKLSYCSPVDEQIEKAIRIIQPLYPPDDNTYNPPNILSFDDTSLSSIGIPKLASVSLLWVVESNSKTKLEREIAISFLKTLHPNSTGHIDEIEAITDYKKLKNFINKYETMHCVTRSVDPLYTRQQSREINFYDSEQFYELLYRKVEVELPDLNFSLNADDDERLFRIQLRESNEKHYGIITNLEMANEKDDPFGVPKYLVTVTIATGESKVLELEEIYDAIVPIHKYHYACDCKEYHSNSYVCSHLLAVWGLSSVNLYNTLQVGANCDIYTKRGVGRPLNALKALQRSRNYNGCRVFDVESDDDDN